MSAYFTLIGRGHKRLLWLSIPMLLSNITAPLLALVDSAVLGHLPDSHYLAGASLGGLVLTQLYWICGFLRMSVTGQSAQTLGKGVLTESGSVLLHSLLLAVFLGILVWLSQGPLLALGLHLGHATPLVAVSATDYFEVRVLSAPFALANLVLMGWLIGQQRVRWVMAIQIVANLANALLDIVLVWGFGMGVAGVAGASALAEVGITCSALFLIMRGYPLARLLPNGLSWRRFSAVLSLNGDILLRNLALQLCLAFVTIQGARLGELTLATNALLMNFFVLIALGLDGIAQGTEALVGQAKGAGKGDRVWHWVKLGLAWSSLLAIVYAGLFYLAGEQILFWLTDLPALRATGQGYLPLMVALPLVAHWCFLFDGVFVGLTRSRAMALTMVLSAKGFFISWSLLAGQGNLGLWLSLLVFFALRGVTLGGYLGYLRHRRVLAV